MKIERVETFPITAKITDPQGTSQADWSQVSCLLVKVTTDDGIVGWGEGLARKAPRAFAHFVDELFAPMLVGQDPFAVEVLWTKMARVFTGRAGGALIEAVAGVDIALWDIIGKSLGSPLYKVLGHAGRDAIPAYASAIGWNDDAVAEHQIGQSLEWGFKEIKVKVGQPLKSAMERARLVRERAGPDVKLSVDANWAFNLDESLEMARALADLGYTWFEEPIEPEDLQGYIKLAGRSPVRLAAGESEFTASGARALLASRAIGVVQPDVARSGGITETRKIITLADAHHIAYAPHIGFSGAICAAASLHLAAASRHCETYECMIFGNPLRDSITKSPVAHRTSLIDGRLAIPQAPGLGIEIDEDAVRKLRV